MSGCEMPFEAKLHSAFAERFSPVLFDRAATLPNDHVDVLLDAARLAPSAGNSQPWMFIVGRRGDATHARIVRHLARSSSSWAPDASVLVVNLAHVFVEGTTFEYSEFAHYDLGQAVSHMILQGSSMGLAAHQFRAFDRDAVATEFAVPPEWEVTSMTALGVAAHAAGEHMAPGTSRERHSREEVTWARS